MKFLIRISRLHYKKKKNLQTLTTFGTTMWKYTLKIEILDLRRWLGNKIQKLIGVIQNSFKFKNVKIGFEFKPVALSIWNLHYYINLIWLRRPINATFWRLSEGIFADEIMAYGRKNLHKMAFQRTTKKKPLQITFRCINIQMPFVEVFSVVQRNTILRGLFCGALKRPLRCFFFFFTLAGRGRVNVYNKRRSHNWDRKPKSRHLLAA